MKVTNCYKLLFSSLIFDFPESDKLVGTKSHSCEGSGINTIFFKNRSYRKYIVFHWKNSFVTFIPGLSYILYFTTNNVISVSGPECNLSSDRCNYDYGPRPYLDEYHHIFSYGNKLSKEKNSFFIIFISVNNRFVFAEFASSLLITFNFIFSPE
jgi:hypothetical protein